MTFAAAERALTNTRNNNTIIAIMSYHIQTCLNISFFVVVHSQKFRMNDGKKNGSNKIDKRNEKK